MVLNFNGFIYFNIISFIEAIEKAYLNVISKTKMDDYCDTLVEEKEQSLDKDSLANFEKMFKRLAFDDNC